MNQNRDAIEAFARLACAPSEQLDLGRAALALAAVFRPSLDTTAYLEELDLMAGALADRVDLDGAPVELVRGINRYLFGELGFRGNADAYYDERNSFLSDVLDRRLGIPITLSLVYIELGRRIGLALDGIGYPGHFLVRLTAAQGEALYVDPFHGGRVLPREALERGLASLPDAGPPRAYLLSAITKRQFLARMLHNLKALYMSSRRHAAAYNAVELLVRLSPWDLDERRDRGLLSAALHNYAGAISDLQSYLEYRPEATDAAAVRQRLDLVRRAAGAGS